MSADASRRELVLPEAEAQAVLLVQSLEEADRTGELLALETRREATRSARQQNSDDEAAWLAERALDLSSQLDRELTFLPRLRSWTRPLRGLLVPAAVVAFVLGVGTNALGPQQHVNVLALPLLGLIAWNLAVLVLLALRAFLPLSLDARVPAFIHRLRAIVRRLIARLPSDDRGEATQKRLRGALESYLRAWLPAVTPLAIARSQRLLHAGSLLLIGGVVAGMYARGIAYQYLATWESTFLSGATVDRFLGVVLAPAAALLDTDVPRAAAIESPATGDGAPWIHLYAVTAALLVGLPRLLLALYESVRCARRRRSVAITLPDGYLRRLLAAVETAQHRIEVLPYSYRPAAPVTTALRQLLLDLFGARSEIRIRETLDYGSEPSDIEAGSGRLRVVLCSLSQTPEVEVHGELLQQFRERLPDGQALLLVVDGSAYRRKLEHEGQLDERSVKRLAERRRAWDRVVRDAALLALHVDLRQPLPDEVLTQAVAAVWPQGSLALEPGASA